MRIWHGVFHWVRVNLIYVVLRKIRRLGKYWENIKINIFEILNSFALIYTHLCACRPQTSLPNNLVAGVFAERAICSSVLQNSQGSCA